MSAPMVNNVKISFRIYKKIDLRSKLKNIDAVKWHGNFAVLRDQFTYVIFFNNGFINATGIRNEERVQAAIRHFFQIFQIKQERLLKSFKIDNIQANGKYNFCINLSKLKAKAILKDTYNSIKLNPYHFSGAIFKHPPYGTIIIFSTGSYIIVGSKCKEDYTHVFQQMTALIQTL